MYRAEFFSYDVQYKDFALFDDDTELSLDYIAWDASQIKIPGKRLAVIKGDLVHITRDGKTAFDGYVNNVSYPSKNVTQVDVLPLLCSLRFGKVYAAGALSGDIALDLYWWVHDRLSDGIDNYFAETTNYPVDPFLKIQSEFDLPPIDADRRFGKSDQVASYSFLEMATYALTAYRAVPKLYLELTQPLRVHYGVDINADEITLESDLDNVIERSITLGNSYGSINKVVIYKQLDTGSYAIAYYLHPDGSVDDNQGLYPEDRIKPIVSTQESIDDSDDWADKALQRAKDIMLPKAYDNEISLTYKSDDALVNPTEIKIGTLATIYAEGVAYQSILTGKVLQNNLIKLIFGSVRVDLTKQLLMERGRI